ncbi:hypothetical protein LJC74_08600, partial [Eubacteriales bacterium OttesenSCG-928-A19]|nr:hypothetical protein [Eubacteriales bacterium OttesenSCG-928-A19]
LHWYDARNIDETIAFDFTTKATEDLTLKTCFEEIVVENTTNSDETDVIIDTDETTPVAPEAKADKDEDIQKIAEDMGLTIRIVEDEKDETEDAKVEENADELNDDMLVILEDDGLMTIEDDNVPLAAPPVALPPKTLDDVSVALQSNHESVMRPGDKVSVWASVNNADDMDLAYQWQYSTDGGATWCDAAGANELEHSFEATYASINYDWRLNVEIVDGSFAIAA